jgi:hypothetical protein
MGDLVAEIIDFHPPTTTGDPFDLATDPTLPKLLGAIQATPSAGRLTGSDRIIFNFLLAAAFPVLEEKEMHEVLTVELRAVLGTKHESNDWLEQSLQRLSSVMMKIPIVDKRGRERFIVTNLVNGSIPRGEGVIHYSFYKELRPLLAKPAVFARIKLAVLAQFSCKYSPPLYEMFEAYANRDHNVWTVKVEELRVWLAIGSKMPNWADFNRFVLAPALDEINRLSDLRIDHLLLRKRRRIDVIRFTINKKPTRELIEAELFHRVVRRPVGHPRPTGRIRDRRTPDFLDGRTDNERGGPPALTSKAIEEFRRCFPGLDVYTYEKEWQEVFAGRGMPRDPDKAFLGWMETKRQRGDLRVHGFLPHSH